MKNKARLRPPVLADRFLKWYCSPYLLDEIQGDLHEAFYVRAQKWSPRKARLLFIMEVIKFFRPSSIKGEKSNYKNNYFMGSNYFKIAIRNLAKHKFYSAINILGLAIGIGCTLLIILFVMNELSYDRFHTNAENIYRITEKFTEDDGAVLENSASIPWAVAPALNADYMDIPTVRMFKAWQKVPLINYKEEDKSFYEENLLFVDTTFFDIFSFPLIKGNPETALKNPQSVIIS